MSRPRPTSGTSPATLLARCGRAPRAFTLIEALVAVGAMALVTVGIAAIFSSVGKTVAAGRRINVLNSYAAMIEQQMRQDFASMTREGFLVVRNSWADVNGNATIDSAPNNNDWVYLNPQDLRPRHRRIDEIMFFANGDFTGVREPLHPAYAATSKNARMYFGHGAQLPTNATFTTNQVPYSQPEPNDPNSAAVTGRLGQPNTPNQYAGSWTLLRHVTLLVNPESTTQKLPPDLVFNWNPTRDVIRLSDKDGQVALQPAAGSIFRSLAHVLPDFGQRGLPPRGYYVREPFRRPRFASGIIDIANSDLTDIRSVVMGMPVPAYGAGHFNNVNQYPPASPGWATGPGWIFTPGPSALTNARTWMENAWPTSSEPVLVQEFPPAANADRGSRIRYNPGPPDYIDAITTARRGGGAEAAYRRSDQLTTTAFNFVPGCTEFIIEWSFGNTDAAGELVWHGLARRADVDNNGTLDRTLARPYPRDSSDTPPGGQDSVFRLKYTGTDGKVHDDKPNPAYPVEPTLIYTNPTPAANAITQTAYFGYFDPRVNDGRPWPWPTLIRVTMSLTDPKNPGPEETFQFVFPTPGNPQ